MDLSQKISNICKDSIFAKVYMDNIQLLRNYLYYKFGDMQNAEDISQNAFIKLWDNCKKISSDKAKSFLFTTATNLFLNDIKHKKVIANYAKNSFTSYTNETPEFTMMEKEFHDKLNKAIADLTDKQREVFLLNRIEKLKYYEIAELLGVSVKAVEKRMHAALIVMRKKIGKV